MSASDAWGEAAALGRAGVDCVVVTITSVRGSVPGSLGGKAVVTAEGLAAGNLGGGRVEAKAIDEATGMLDGEGVDVREALWNLQRDVGMTCGGEMGFLFERVRAGTSWHVVVFGAGHVSQALVPVLATLPCRIDVIDVRSDWLGRIPESGNVTPRRVERFEDGVQWVAPDSDLLSITQGHATDRPVLREALGRFPDLPFTGVIGSAAKRAVLLKELREDGIPEAVLEKLVCPVGLPIGGNDPAEIAISIAAQLLEHRTSPRER